MADPGTSSLRHFTLRRGFVIFVGLWILTLYFLWAFYGAAPTSLSFLSEAQDEAQDEGMGGMAGMAEAGEGAGMTPDEFGEITDKFVEDLSLPDGSVRPTREWTRQYGPHRGGEEGEAVDPDQAARTAADITVEVTREEEVAREEEEHVHDEDRRLSDGDAVFLHAERIAVKAWRSLSLPYDVDGRRPRRKH